MPARQHTPPSGTAVVRRRTGAARAATTPAAASAAPLRLVRVRDCDAHVDALYQLLAARRHGISHASMPTMAMHRRFVRRHPYRVWYLLQAGGAWIGSLYLLPSNAVGLSMRDGCHGRVPEVLARLFARHRPLPAVPSVRAGSFSFNVSPSDRRLIAALKAMGGAAIQHTYVLPDAAGR